MSSCLEIFSYCDELVDEFEKVISCPKKEKSSVYYTGVDLGTAYVVLAVLDENKKPVAGAYRRASVVKDGMVVDYMGAIKIVRELKNEIEEKLDEKLVYAAAALPPGTTSLDSGAIKHVVQGAGFELTALLDEPTAGLDPRGRDEILQEIKEIHKRHNTTIILVSHSMEDISKLVDKIIVMNRGQIEFVGSPREIFKHETRLKEIGLGVPKVVELVKALREKGFDIAEDRMTIEEVKEEIIRILRSKKDA